METLEQCVICSKFIIKTPERRQCRRSGVIIVNFEQISYIVLVFPIVEFELLNVGWVFNG